MSDQEFATEELSDQHGRFQFIKGQNVVSKPSLSVIMSVYNGRKYLSEAVESILGQTFTDFEFIIIDDGSSDESGDIISDYQKQDNRILLVRQSNIGLTKSLNRALRLAKAEFVARQDADDISLPHRFNEQLNYIKAHSKIALVGCLHEIFSNDQVLRKDKNLKFSAKGIKRFLAKSNLFIHGEVLYRKSCVFEVGLYREFFRYAQDYDLWLRLAHNYDFAVIPQHHYRYRITTEAISISLYPTQKKYADLARQFHSERLATGKDSYNSVIVANPAGFPVTRISADSCDYYMRLAEELIASGSLDKARIEIEKARQLGCRDGRIAKAYLKTLMGAPLLNVCRTVKNFQYRF